MNSSKSTHAKNRQAEFDSHDESEMKIDEQPVVSKAPRRIAQSIREKSEEIIPEITSDACAVATSSSATAISLARTDAPLGVVRERKPSKKLVQSLQQD